MRAALERESVHVARNPVQYHRDVDPVIQGRDPAADLARIAQPVSAGVNREDGVTKGIFGIGEDA